MIVEMIVVMMEPELELLELLELERSGAPANG